MYFDENEQSLIDVLNIRGCPKNRIKEFIKNSFIMLSLLPRDTNYHFKNIVALVYFLWFLNTFSFSPDNNLNPTFG